LLFVLCLMMLYSCMSTQPQGKSVLLRSNRIKIDKPYIAPSDLESFVTQKPSRRFLFSTTWNQRVYERTQSGKPTRFKRWINREIVKKPVYLDTNLSNQSCRQLKLYMDNIGHFDSKVTKSIRNNSRTARVSYHVHAGEPYRIKSLQWIIQDSVIQNIVYNAPEKSLLAEGDIYNAYTMDAERGRVTLLLKQNGYFAFAKEYINYKVDTNLSGNELNVKAFISNPDTNGLGKSDDGKHAMYDIGDIRIYPDYDPYTGQDTTADTSQYYDGTGAIEGQKYVFISSNPMRLRQSFVAGSLFIRSGNSF